MHDKLKMQQVINKKKQYKNQTKSDQKSLVKDNVISQKNKIDLQSILNRFLFFCPLEILKLMSSLDIRNVSEYDEIRLDSNNYSSV